MAFAPMRTNAPDCRREAESRRESAAALRSIRDVEKACPGLTAGRPPRCF